MARACGSYPQCPRFESRCRYQIKAQRFTLRLLYGPLVKRLRHRPFTAVTWVRFPYGSPKRETRKSVSLFLMGIFFVFIQDRLLRSGAGTILCGSAVYGVNAVVSLLYGPSAEYNAYSVNFSDWSANMNGNILLLVMLITLVVGCALPLSSPIRKKLNSTD